MLIPCDERYFTVCLINIRSETTAAGRELLRIMVRDTMNSCIHAPDGKLLFFTDDDGMLNCVVNTFNPEPRRMFEAALAEARSQPRNVEDLHLFFAVGPAGNTLGELCYSRAAARHVMLHKQSSISYGERSAFPMPNILVRFLSRKWERHLWSFRIHSKYRTKEKI